ncbi:MAG: hypothetical protein ABR961_16450 [Thermoanaerobaculaceae bacterium]
MNGPSDAPSSTEAAVPAGVKGLLCAIGALSPAILDAWLARVPPTTAVIDWQAIAGRAREWRITTATWAALSLATRLFATPIPAGVLDALSPGPLRRAAIRALGIDRGILLGRTHGYSLRRGLIWLVMTDRLSSVFRFLVRTIVPKANWLRARWGTTPEAPVLPLLAKHWRSLLLEQRS